MAKGTRSKPTASLRTIDLFDGKTELEKQEAIALETLEEGPRERAVPSLKTLDEDIRQWRTMGYTALDGWRLVRGDSGQYLLQKVGYGGHCTTTLVLPGGQEFIELARQFYLAAKELAGK